GVGVTTQTSAGSQNVPSHRPGTPRGASSTITPIIAATTVHDGGACWTHVAAGHAAIISSRVISAAQRAGASTTTPPIIAATTVHDGGACWTHVAAGHAAIISSSVISAAKSACAA